MSKTLFTGDWYFQRNSDSESILVRLPHDAMIGESRSADSASGNHGGYFPGGYYTYTKQWTVPMDADQVLYRLVFESVYGDTCVKVDDVEVTRCNSGYRSFSASLTGLAPGKSVTIQVIVNNTQLPNGRWYTGSGIYRSVWLEALQPSHIADDGVKFVTKILEPNTVVGVDVKVEGAKENHIVYVELEDANGLSSIAIMPINNGKASGELQVTSTRLWSAEDPHLYTASVSLMENDVVIDKRQLRVGIRTIDIDSEQGLRINNKQVLLRGACVHSDNGILGAVSLPAAEHRRIRILKACGFNAIRASHNPMSPAFLDACDEIGMYVVDELTDVWFQRKTKYDSAGRFEEVWRDDVRAMVAEDRNRPSVIMYSIGNEVAETATERGVSVAGEINDFVHHLDPTRPTTLAINLLLNMMAKRGSSPFDSEKYTGEGTKNKKKETTSTVANMLTAKLGVVMGLISRLPAADKASKDAFAKVDVAGYNYAFGRYSGDRKKYPERIILGSESMPGDIPSIWQRVTSVPGVIGDFMWTGWDYLGEAGIGTWSYGKEPGGIDKPYPALLAGTGAIDITGMPGAPTFLSRAVWDLLDAPAIAVRPPINAGKRTNKTPWRSTDAISSWAWRGTKGKVSVEVYSSDDEVELILNGRSIGRKKSGKQVKFMTRFSVPYEQGEVVAIGYRNGSESGRSSLRSAQTARLRLRSETDILVGSDDLAYVWIELADNNGVVESMSNDKVTIHIEGPGLLMGFGCAAPITEDNYTDSVSSTYFGRALAIIRATSCSADFITLSASSERHGDATLKLKVKKT